MPLRKFFSKLPKNNRNILYAAISMKVKWEIACDSDRGLQKTQKKESVIKY